MKKDLLLIALLLIPALTPLFRPGYFSMHDDLQSMRHLEMAKCFSDGQIPCRWVPDLGYGYGFPLFNYYPSLPYLVGQLYHWLGFSYGDIVKAVGFTGFLVTAIFMYVLGREFWGRGGGLISSILYSYAPYHAVDFYVRGAMDEFWAMAFYPAIFWTTYKLIKTGSLKWIPWVALSVCGLMLSHNPMLMIFTPVCLAWIIFWWIKFRSLSSFKSLALSGLFAFGLAAFFTLPVLFEQKFVHVDTLIIGYFNYLQHFVPVSRMFWVMNWGYGASNLGQTEHLSFNLGYLQWLIPLFLLIALPFTSRLRKHASLLLLLLFIVLSALFMMHARSSFIWDRLPPLAYLQFPWRFLTLAVFAAAFLSGALAQVISGKAIALVLLATLILNAQYFHPREYYPDLTDAVKFSGLSWQKLTNSAVFDYLPIWAPQPPADPPGSDLNLVSGMGTFTSRVKKSNLQLYELHITSSSAVAELQTFYFPGWRVWVDGREQPLNPKSDPLLGRIRVPLTSGTHTLTASFANTPVRTIGNFLSAAAWVFLLCLFGRSVILPRQKRI